MKTMKKKRRWMWKMRMKRISRYFCKPMKSSHLLHSIVKLMQSRRNRRCAVEVMCVVSFRKIKNHYLTTCFQPLLRHDQDEVG